jgi:hypothetical protein
MENVTNGAVTTITEFKFAANEPLNLVSEMRSEANKWADLAVSWGLLGVYKTAQVCAIAADQLASYADGIEKAVRLLVPPAIPSFGPER